MGYDDTEEQVCEYFAQREEEAVIADAWAVRLQEINYQEAMSWCEENYF